MEDVHRLLAGIGGLGERWVLTAFYGAVCGCLRCLV
jgi:hypothetical protein